MPLIEYDKPLSIEIVILTQVLSIGQLSTRIYFSPRSEWQTNALNIAYAVGILESMAYPYLTKRYHDKMKKLNAKWEEILTKHKKDKTEKNEAYLKKGQNFEMHLTLAYVQIQFKYIQRELETSGILRKRTTSAMDEGGLPTTDEGALDGTLDIVAPDEVLRNQPVL